MNETNDQPRDPATEPGTGAGIDDTRKPSDDAAESLLASTYLDGEATADERALVETSTDTLATVRRLADVRTVLAHTAPEASLSQREAHLAAALDVWARLSESERLGESTPSAGIDAAAAAAVLTPTSSSGRSRSTRRPRSRSSSMSGSQWILGAAAALVLIAGVGAAVRGVLVARDDAQTQAVVAPAADKASELDALETAEAEEVAGGNVGDELDSSVSDLSEVAAGSGLFVEQTSEASDTTLSEQSADAALPSGAEQPAPAGDDPLISIETPEDLGVYATLAIPTATGEVDRNDDIDFEAPFGSCENQLGVQKQLEPVIYRGAEVVVGVDLDSRVVFAYTALDCNVVERVALPADTRERPDVVTTSP